MSSLEIVRIASLPGVRMIVPHRHEDERGFLSEIWREDALRNAGIVHPFVQENHTLSRARGTVRGLHFQIAGAAQAKLVRCSRGSILDVAVDIRRGSPTFGRHAAIVLSRKNWQQVYVPQGFAHGYCTLEPDTEVIYKVTAYYDPPSERGIAWDDPQIGIAWPVAPKEAILTERDRALPRLSELADFFPYASFAECDA
jgi:dTDP-4-dehydrorhamnose 3,5-epimerase